MTQLQRMRLVRPPDRTSVEPLRDTPFEGGTQPISVGITAELLTPSEVTEFGESIVLAQQNPNHLALELAIRYGFDFLGVSTHTGHKKFYWCPLASARGHLREIASRFCHRSYGDGHRSKDRGWVPLSLREVASYRHRRKVKRRMQKRRNGRCFLIDKSWF
jgi:hypothetical protein